MVSPGAPRESFSEGINAHMSSSKDEGIAPREGGGPEAMVGWSDVVAEEYGWSGGGL